MTCPAARKEGKGGRSPRLRHRRQREVPHDALGVVPPVGQRRLLRFIEVPGVGHQSRTSLAKSCRTQPTMTLAGDSWLAAHPATLISMTLSPHNANLLPFMYPWEVFAGYRGSALTWGWARVTYSSSSRKRVVCLGPVLPQANANHAGARRIRFPLPDGVAWHMRYLVNQLWSAPRAGARLTFAVPARTRWVPLTPVHRGKQARLCGEISRDARLPWCQAALMSPLDVHGSGVSAVWTVWFCCRLGQSGGARVDLPNGHGHKTGR